MSKWAGTDSSSNRAGTAACCCRRWPWNGAGAPTRFWRTRAEKRACPPTRGTTRVRRSGDSRLKCSAKLNSKPKTDVWRLMRSFIFLLHLTVALVAGAFVVILGVTGSILAFEPELGHVLNRRLSYVARQDSPRSLAELGAAASAAVPGQRVTGYLLSTSPTVSYQVAFRGRLAFVNQYTGEVLGVRDLGPDLLSRIHQLHLRLLLQNQADSGKTIVKWVGVATLFLLLSGAYLWWPLKRFSVRKRGGARRVWFDLHNTVGIASLLFLLLATLTGIVIGFDDTLDPLIYRATGTRPVAVYGRPAFTSTPSSAPAISPDRAVEIARAALPGADPISVNVPAPSGVYAISARYPEDLTPGGRSRIYIEQYSGAVLLAEGSRTAPAGTRLITLNRALHTGDVFGLPSKVVMSIASLALVLQLISGAVMWLRR